MINAILKELFKMLKEFFLFKEKGLKVYSLEDAKTFVNKLKEVVDFIKNDKLERTKKIKSM